MSKMTSIRFSLLATILAASPAFAGGANDMIDQLLPTHAKPIAALPEAAVLSVQAATKDEIVGRLGSDPLTRSIDPKTARAKSILLGAGHEAEDLQALRTLPSMQVAVAFQGSSDALAPESGALLGTLAAALNDPKLASYRFAIGVHTDSVGSDAYNLSLSSLRAQAIVDQLVAAQGIGKGRLFAIGFGRLVDPNGTPGERIRVVNLENTVVLSKPAEAASAPAAVRPPIGKSGAKVTHAKKTLAARVVRRRAPVADRVAVVKHAHRRQVSARFSPEPRYHGARIVRTRAAPDDMGYQSAYPASASWSAYGTTYGGGRGGNGGSNGGGSGSGSSSASASSGGASSSSGSGSAGGTSSASSGGASSGGAASGGAAGGSSSGGAGGGQGGGWSDRRLKRQITRIGTSPSGLAIYSFRYVWGGPMMVGVMAQDLLLTRPDVVIVGPGGYMQVDYAKIDVKMMTLEAWSRGSVARMM